METILHFGRCTRAWPVWARYGTAVAFVLLTVLIRTLLAEQLQEHPFLLFFPTVLVCTFLFQLRVVACALVFDVALTLHFLVEPRGEFRAADLNDAVRLATAGIMVAIMGLVLQSLINAHDQLRAGYDDLSRTEALKTVLMGEMHHRIKNNLQLVASMLRLEAGATTNEEAKAMLRGSAERVAVIGRLHEQLQGIGAADRVDMRSFVEDLCTNLRAAAVGKRSIEIIACVDPIMLPSEHATTVGLIVNELATNALKYAFSGGRGTISIRLERSTPSLLLSVCDDGQGLQGAVAGTGTRLLRAMVSRLNGQIEASQNNGTSVAVRFPDLL